MAIAGVCFLLGVSGDLAIGAADVTAGHDTPSPLPVRMTQAGAPITAYLATATPPTQTDGYTLLEPDMPGVRSFGDTYDVAVRWICGSDWDYLIDTGSGPGPCLGMTYDGATESCGVNVFTGAGVEVLETEHDNGDGTITIIVQVGSADGSDMLPNGQPCPAALRSGMTITTLEWDLAKLNAGGPGIPGDPLDPNTGVSPFEITKAEGVIFGLSGNPLLTLDFGLTGTMATDLKFRFSVSGLNQVGVRAGQFCYTVTGPPVDDPLLEPGTKHSAPASPCDCEPCKDEDGLVLDPVYLYSGEFYEAYEDLRVAGRGVDFVWARKYRSRIGPDTAAGNGWDFGYNVYLEEDGADLLLHDGNTRTDRYSPGPGGAWTDEEFFREITQNGDGSYTLTFADTGAWDFVALDGSPQAGRLSAVRDRNGNTLSFNYDTLGRLTTIHDALDTPAHNRDFTIAYNADGFVASVTDFVGRQVTYAYYQNGEPGGSFGDLKSVTTPAVVGTPHGNDFPAGKSTVFTYTTGFADDRLNHDLLTITDGKGQTYLVNTYAHTVDPNDPRFTTDPNNINFDRIVRQVWGDPGDIIDVVYVSQTPSPANNNAVIKVITNDRVGNVKEFFYDDRNRGVMERHYTGRAPDADASTAETVNRPTAQLRPSDPAFFETRYEYNDDSLVTRITHPNGNVTQNIYESDLDPNTPVRSRGNLREVRRLPGPLGGDQAQISEFFEYDVDQGGCCGTNFVTRHTDGRGNVTQHAYDGAGNRTQTIHRIPTIVEDFEYNAFGQMTAHVLPDNGSGHRRRDAYTYFAAGSQTGYLQSKILDATGFALTSAYEYDDLGRLTRIIDPRGHDTLYTYNALDQVVRETSREVTDGSGVRYERDNFYDANNNIVRVDVQSIDADGVLQANTHFSTVYDRDILNRRIRSSREVGSATLGPNDLDSTSLPLSEFIVTEYEYDANRNRTLVASGEATSGSQPANVVRTRYDERDLVFREVRAEGDADQSSTQFDYDGNHNRVVVREGLEDTPRVTTFTYDGYDRLTGVGDPMGNQATIQYDANGNRILERADGELIDVTVGSPAGNVRQWEVVYSYDPLDRRTQIDVAHFDAATQTNVGDGLATTQTEYSDNSQVVRVTDDNAHQTLTTYDTANRRSVVTDHLGNSTIFTYDANSNVVTVTEVDKSDLGNPDETFGTGYTYDNLDRLIRIVDNVQNTTERGYDSRDNRTVAIDALRPINPTDPGNVVQYAYDGINRLTATTRLMTDDGTGTGAPAGTLITLRAWDDASRLVAETDAVGNTTSYTYDALDRVTAASFADGTTETYAYDVHDNITGRSDANGNVVTSTFDLANRVTQRLITLGVGVSNDTTFENYQYDGLSRMVRAEDDDSVVAFEYDSLTNVTAETLNGQTTTRVFDGEGNTVQCAYPGGRTVNCTYDELDRKSLITDGAGAIAAINYIGGGRMERRSLGNNTRTDFTYDNLRRITGTSHVFDPGGAATVVDQRGYQWDRMSNKIGRTDLRAGGPQLTHAYAYDAIYRLTGATVTDSVARATLRDTDYQLDGAGNRIAVTGAPATGTYALDASVPQPADAQLNQYTTTPFDTRTYDENGNLVEIRSLLLPDLDDDNDVDSGDFALFAQCFAPGEVPTPACEAADFDGSGDVGSPDFAFFAQCFGGALLPPAPSCAFGGTLATMAYDFDNRMVEYVDVANGQRHTYAYDALNRRIARVVDADGTADETRYFYDDWRVCEEQDGAGATLATYVYGEYMDDVLNMQRDTDASGTPEDYLYHTDDLYSVMAVTNASGTVVERYEYDDFGEPAIMDAASNPISQSAIDNQYLFTGRRFDRETGWYYYRMRYGDPAVGRFTARDPLGLWGDGAALGNAFTLGANRPVSGVDPTGLAWVFNGIKAKPIGKEWGQNYDKKTGTLKEPHYTEPDSYTDDSRMTGKYSVTPLPHGGRGEVANTYVQDNLGGDARFSTGATWSRLYECNQTTGIPELVDDGRSTVVKPSPEFRDGDAFSQMEVNISGEGGPNVHISVSVSAGISSVTKLKNHMVTNARGGVGPGGQARTANFALGNYFTKNPEKNSKNVFGDSVSWDISCRCVAPPAGRGGSGTTPVVPGGK